MPVTAVAVLATSNASGSLDPRGAPALPPPVSQGGESCDSTPVLSLLNTLAPDAFPPGEKDTSDTLGNLRIGWGLWDGGAGEKGYFHCVARMDDTEKEFYLEQHLWAADDPCSGVAEKDFPLAEFSPMPADLAADYAPEVYDRCYIKFSLDENDPDCMNCCTAEPCSDLDEIEACTPNANFFTHQQSVFSPRVTDVENDPENVAGFWFDGYDELESLVNATVAIPGKDYLYARNIGFAGQPGFAGGEFNFNYQNSLVAKSTACGGSYTDCLERFPVEYLHRLGKLSSTVPPTVPVFWARSGSMLPADAATLLWRNIEELLSVPSLLPPTYYMVGGEFSIASSLALQPAFGLEGVIFPPGCELELPCPPPEDPQPLGCDCSTISSREEFLRCLPSTDYSDESMLHFRCWLEEKYTSFGTLAAAWGNPAPHACAGSFSDFENVDPLRPPIGDYQAIYDDWMEFQEEQYWVEAFGFQYNAAKLTDPDGRMYHFHHRAKGMELAALLSDGSASIDFYQDIGPGDSDPRNLALTSMKRTTLHGLSYGESINFPLFELLPIFDQMPPNGIPWASPCEGVAPEGFDTPYHYDLFAERTYAEFLMLGIDSWGVSYWEDYGFGDRYSDSIKYVRRFSDNAKEIRSERAFMSPWRSPLIVHTGERFVQDHKIREMPGLDDKESLKRYDDLNEVLEELSVSQAQFSCFGESLGFEDLWLTSSRELLLSPFVPDLDADLIQTYVDEAEHHGWRVVIYTDEDTFDPASSPPPCLGASPVASYDVPTDACNPGAGSTSVSVSTAPGDVYELLDSSSAVIGRVFVFQDPATALPYLEQEMLAQLEAEICTSIRPIRAIESSPSSPPALLAVTVMTDGINLMASIASTESNPTTVDYEWVIDPSLPGTYVESPLFGSFDVTVPDPECVEPDDATLSDSALTHDHDDGALVPGEVEGTFFRRNISGLSELSEELTCTVDDFEDLIEAEEAKVMGFVDTSACRSILDELDHIQVNETDSDIRNSKILAGLLRAYRTSLIRYFPNRGDLVVVTNIAGDPIEDAILQVEHSLFHHRRTDLASPLQTNALGRATVNPNPPAGSKVWDFRIADPHAFPEPVSGYTTTPWGEGEDPRFMFEIHALHPDYQTQSRHFYDSN